MKPHDQWNSRDIGMHVYGTGSWAHSPRKPEPRNTILTPIAAGLIVAFMGWWAYDATPTFIEWVEANNAHPDCC